MARQFLTNIDLAKNELQNARIQNLGSAPGTPVSGQIYFDTTDDTLYFYDGVGWVDAGAGGFSQEQGEDFIATMLTTGVQTGIVVSYDDPNGQIDFVLDDLNELPAPTGNLSLASYKITNLGTPSDATDAATKGYVDTVFTGLSWKDAVVAASTAAGTLASDYENGDTLDGVTLATGDRILLKNQSAPEENGIYVVNVSGAPTRATDADSAAEVLGAAVFVQGGTANDNTAWVMTTNAPITLGTTGLVWTQFGAGATYTAGAGLTLTGNDFSVNVDDSTIEINTDTLRVKDGGITDAKLASTFTKKYAADIGDNSSTTITVTHNLGTRDVVVSVHDNASVYSEVYPEIRKATTNTVDLVFSVAPTTAQYRVSVIG